MGNWKIGTLHQELCKEPRPEGVKVGKQKFDALLDRLIQTPPTKRRTMKTTNDLPDG
jgi:hypothetical protein